MPAPNAATYLALLTTRLTLTTDETLYASSVAPTYADRVDPEQAIVGPRRQWLYVERDVLRKRLSDATEQTTYVNGPEEQRDSDITKNLVAQIAQVDAAIAAVEALEKGRRSSGASGPMTAVSPVAPPAGSFDAQYVGYRGSPYIPFRGRGRY